METKQWDVSIQIEEQPVCGNLNSWRGLRHQCRSAFVQPQTFGTQGPQSLVSGIILQMRPPKRCLAIIYWQCVPA